MTFRRHVNIQLIVYLVFEIGNREILTGVEQSVDH